MEAEVKAINTCLAGNLSCSKQSGPASVDVVANSISQAMANEIPADGQSAAQQMSMNVRQPECTSSADMPSGEQQFHQLLSHILVCAMHHISLAISTDEGFLTRMQVQCSARCLEYVNTTSKLD